MENFNKLDNKNDASVEEQIKELKEEIGEIMSILQNFNVDDLKRGFADMYHDAKSRSSESLHEAKHKLNDFQEQLCEEVSEKPLCSVAIAAGIGLIIGLLSRR